MLPTPYHIESHFRAPQIVRDIVIGMADGLTVPFALAAGLSGTIDSSHIVLTAGLAEIAAGSVAMGLGGYLAARTDREHFKAERAREERETRDIPEVEAEEVASIFREFGLTEDQIQGVVKALQRDPAKFVDFMMKFELGISAPEPSRARNSAITIALAYVLGGSIPLWPYLWWPTSTALPVSALCTAVALLTFGYVKGKLTIDRPFRGALSTFAVGSLAAATAYFLASALT